MLRPTSSLRNGALGLLRASSSRLVLRNQMGIFSFKGFVGMKPKIEVDPGRIEGTDLRIVKYPDPILRTENQIVTVFDDSLRKLADEMLLVMYASDGIGLAAPQVGINKRIMVFNEHGEPKRKEHEMVLVNPVIVSKSEEMVAGEEGCLSFPQIRGQVNRHVWIEVKYQDVTGKSIVTRFEKFPAVIFQHEYDHLDKVLFIDKFDEKERNSNRKFLERAIKKYGPGAAV
eukprot:gene30498-36861_t